MSAIVFFDSAYPAAAAAIAQVGTPWYGLGGETYTVVKPGFKGTYTRGGVMSEANFKFAEAKLGREYLAQPRSIPELRQLSSEIEALRAGDQGG